MSRWALLFVLLGPLPASAQLGVVMRTGPNAWRCATELADCSPSDPCDAPLDTCFFDSVCAPPDAILCSPGTVSMPCPSGEGVLYPVDGEAFYVCLMAAPETRCRLTLSCFVTPGGALARFPGGDCDDDGIPNSMEVDGYVCEPAPALGIVTNEGCVPAPPCDPAMSAACPGAATCRSIGVGGYCVIGEPLWCCTAGAEALECPDAAGDVCVSAVGEAAAVCDTDWCPDAPFAMRKRCYFDADGDVLADASEGDCDLDGIFNGDEVPGEECVFNAPLDAGVSADAGTVAPGPDGGAAPSDAGDAPDASTPDAGAAQPFDAGPPRAPGSFGGGGGCRCGAAPPSRGGLGGLGLGGLGLGLLALGLLARASRRRA